MSCVIFCRSGVLPRADEAGDSSDGWGSAVTYTIADCSVYSAIKMAPTYHTGPPLDPRHHSNI